MPDLPHGWRMRNSEGEKKGPPVEDNIFHSGDEGSEPGSDQLDIRPDSEGWDDVEDDTEEVMVKDLLSDKTFPSASAMIEYCKETHGLDFLAVIRDNKLDFYSAIKLINYIRSEVKAGQAKPKVTDSTLWSDDKYLQPVLEDDALLFNLDDLVDTAVPEDEEKTKEAES
ncbi:Hypothetical predicted protein [Lecanosticta acicola]|uniref:type I protein arginine methyltransferase n=1 Tax=Lecanosticta acicola TaxID=111012 RepID=A0AAI8VV43_9PEZI|nr:Hypothetical predicted protein [Lecanosticta acicola]